MRPLFNRAPLTPNAVAPLSAGAIRPDGWLAEQLKLQLAAMKELPAASEPVEKARLLDARIALAWALNDAELKQACLDEVAALVATERPDGSFGDPGAPLTAAAADLNALRRLFCATNDKKLLPVMDHFFKYLYRRLDTDPLQGDECARGADLIELALWLYDLAGQSYLLKLCTKLRLQTIDWPDVFHTFPVKTPMSRKVIARRLNEGLSDEQAEGFLLEGMSRPYFATLAHTADGADVASGLKAPGVFNLIKSGFKEKDGFSFGWKKLMESHGVANGLFTCDTKLNGRNPIQGTDLAAIAELMSSLETLIGLSGLNEHNAIDRLAEILEKVAFNALPAAFSADMRERQRLQQTNQVCVSREARPWYDADDDAGLFSSRVSEGWDAWPRFVSSLWYATDDDGLLAASYAPCTVRAAAGNVPMRLRVSGGYPFSGSVRITVDVQRSAEFPLYLRIPAWAEQPMIYLPNGEIMQVRAGEYACVRRTWNNGDVLRLDLPASPRMDRWFLHSASVELGPLVMVCQPEEEWETESEGVSRVRTSAPWNWALLQQEPMKAVYSEEERTAPFHAAVGAGLLVKAMAAPVDWDATRDSEGYTTGNAGSVPMGKPATGATCVLPLVPYGDTVLRIAQFPVIG